VHATYCVVGLAVIITRSVLLFSTIKYAGACYLIYIGLQSLFHRKATTSSTKTITCAVPTISSRSAFMQGFLCNLLNPKLAVFLLSLFTQFISADATIADKMMVAAVFVGGSAICWPSLVLLLQAKAIRGLFTEFGPIFERLCGGLLVFLGVKVALSVEN
jgi:threonine/homoserine/homoserine lactone efflux protein